MRWLLHPTGQLLFSTMNTSCLRARIERGRWMSYEDPTHFYYFNRRSLQRVLSSGGFQRVREWKPKIHYPHHGTLRRCIYGVSTVFGVSDGLYYLCSTAAEDPKLKVQPRDSRGADVLPPLDGEALSKAKPPIRTGKEFPMTTRPANLP